LMGGGKTMYLGNLMTEQFLRVRDWPFGAAVCLTMMASIGIAVLWLQRVYRP
jgi:spermidine/putrescine transport system permease protein